MIFAAKLESWVHRQWAQRGIVPCLLYPLTFLYRAAAAQKRRSTVPHRLPVPVVVVGNIYVGGTGKTPVTIALVKALRMRGWHPGVVSRGFGRNDQGVRLVAPDSPAHEVGDEPLLIAHESLAPVAVGRNRFEAATLLLKTHPEIDLIVSDDGLQHTALARDVELAVVGARGLGNGWTLPAGPLREPPSRLDAVDAIVINTTTDVPFSSRTPRFAASSCFGACTQIATGEIDDIDQLAAKLADSNGSALAAAGIASPGRFFAMVRAHDIECAELELGDHYDFSKNPFADRTEDMILITGKDAVKCVKIPAIKSDPRIWMVGLEVELDPYLIDLVDQKAGEAAKRLGRHPEGRNDTI